MMKYKYWLVVLAALVGATVAHAVDVPAPVRSDARLGEVVYDDKSITHVYVMPSVVTHIVLGADESIVQVATGSPSRCKEEGDKWCISAESGTRHIFVKARPGSSDYNNLAVVTTKRNYSFVFQAVADSAVVKAHHRVTYTYPEVVSAEANQKSFEQAPAIVEKHNLNYWMQVMENSRLLAPVAAWDNGVFTYFQFAPGKPVPAIFAWTDDGAETIVSRHMQGNTVVVHRVGRRFILRLDDATVGVWNESYDQHVGNPLDKGVTVQGYERGVNK
jgi:type IV secretion system protein VirB9